MPTNKPRFTITIPEDLLIQIETYRFTAKCKNQTQAINSLIRKGLDSVMPDDERYNSYSSDSLEILKKYEALDDYGKTIIKILLDSEITCKKKGW